MFGPIDLYKTARLARSQRPIVIVGFALILATLVVSTPIATASEAKWIWETSADKEQTVAAGTVAYFRKQINLKVAATGKVEITADDSFELFINGQSVDTGSSSSRDLKSIDISQYLVVGKNIVAIKVENKQGDTAGLAARVAVKPEGSDQWFNFNSDATWRVTTQSSPMWQTVVFNDRLWGVAAEIGTLGDSVPEDRQERVANQSTVEEQSERFQIQKGFGVQRIMTDQQIGSVIAMTFNEFGHLIVSQEDGPLLLVYDKDDDGTPDEVRTYCDQVSSCQGILALNGEVFVTGMGPDGHAMYRLTDEDRNGTLEKVRLVIKFDGQFGEHGAHGLRLGPDGMIYVVLGGYVQATGDGGPGETLRDYYEGDLLPRYEDPTGHGVGIQAPGGTLIRTNPEGSVVERVAGGLRNAYDLVFHPSGGLFIHDADMEADVDTAWYRPTALFDVTEAGEFGWRPGWSKWPEYYLDRLPNLADTGRGSPTGAACYEHYMFPVRYQNSIFLADWSEGRILNVRTKSNGSGFEAETEVFLEGQPLNVTDLEVGPDGGLYFCTGGRGTLGGIYRVYYKGDVPDRMKAVGTGVAAAVRQPQIESAWARQEVATIKRELGSRWGQLIAGVAYSDENPPHYRTRAMDLMQMFGPAPSDELLIELSQSTNESVRARAASLMGLHPSVEIRDTLQKLLEDPNARVQRSACEAILRSGQIPASATAVIKLMGSDDRTLAFVARRVLERMPVNQFNNEILNHPDPHTKVLGMMAMIAADTNEETCRTVLRHAGLLLDGYLSDADFVDTLRLCEIAIARGKIRPEGLERLRDQVAQEFPAGDPRMNRELIRLSAYLGADSVADRALKYISGDASFEDRSIVAMHLQFLADEWTPQQRFELLKFYENAAIRPTEGSLSLYVMAVTRDFAASLSDEDVAAIIEQGAVWRNAALAAMYRVERPVSDANAKRLRNLDQQLIASPKVGDVQRRLRAGIVAMLSTAQDDESWEYLRRLWRTEPERRAPIAMALAQSPDGENWDYLVRSLNVLEDGTSDEVINALLGVEVATDDPMALRHLILLGVRNDQLGQPFEQVERLLEHWTGLQRPEKAAASMRPWQKWFAKTYPDLPPAEAPDADQSRWDFEQLVSYLDSHEGRFGDVVAGQEAYEKIQCSSCHQFDGVGESVGPNLTNLARRFNKREIIESILYPNHVVSDQFASKKVLMIDGRVIVGQVATQNGKMTIRDANSDVVEVTQDEVDQILPNTSSIMPSGLLDSLTLQEISDLMAYLGVNQTLEIASENDDRR
jgi:putative heme-binding domain-containing protein